MSSNSVGKRMKRSILSVVLFQAALFTHVFAATPAKSGAGTSAKPAAAAAAKPASAAPAAAAAPAPAPSPIRKAFPITDESGLLLTISDNWTYTFDRQAPRDFPTIRLTGDSRRFVMQIAFLPTLTLDKDYGTSIKIRKRAEEEGKKLLGQSKETSLNIEDLKGEHIIASWFTLTSKSSGGSFPATTTVIASTADLLYQVTLRHREAAPERQAVLDILKNVAPTPKPAAGTPAPIAMRVASPPGGTRWDLVLPSGFELRKEEVDPSKKTHKLSATNNNNGFLLTVSIEPAKKPGDVTVARTYYWDRIQKTSAEREGLTQSKIGEFATVEYLIAQQDCVKVNLKNLHLFGARDRSWIDIHISRYEFADEHKPQLDEAARSIKFEAPPARS